MKNDLVYAARIAGIPIMFAVACLFLIAGLALVLVGGVLRLAGAVVASDAWQIGLGPAIAFAGCIWLALRGLR